MLRDYTREELYFVIFCIENVAKRLGIDSTKVYDMFTRESDILESYIVPCYDVLHTQGKEYIVDDLLGLMREKGMSI